MNSYKKILILLAILSSLILFDIIFNIYHAFEYEKRKNDGNERWNEVYNIISEQQKEIEMIKEKVNR